MCVESDWSENPSVFLVLASPLWGTWPWAGLSELHVCNNSSFLFLEVNWADESEAFKASGIDSSYFITIPEADSNEHIVSGLLVGLCPS